MDSRNNDDLTDEQVDAASRPIAAIVFAEKNGQKEVSFVLRRACATGTVNDVGAAKSDTGNSSSSTSNENDANKTASAPGDFDCQVKQSIRWEFAWCTVLDDNNFSLLAALVNEHAPGVCYIADSVMSAAAAHRGAKKFLAALSICEVVAKPAGHFKMGQSSSALLTLTGKTSLQFIPGLGQAPGAAGCVSCLIRHEVPRDLDGSEGTYRVVALDSTNHMKLDHAAVAALHLFPVSRSEDRFNSLFGTLNVCKTKKIGARMLERWIRQPLLAVDDIVARQNLVQIFVEEQLVRQNLRDEHLQGVPDLQRIVRKFDLGKASLEDVYHFYNFCQTLQPILALLSEVEGDQVPALQKEFITPLSEMVTHLKPFIAMVHIVLDFKALDRIPPVFQINPTCEMAQQYGLRELDEQINECMDSINALFEEEYVPNFGIKNLSLDRHSSYGYCLRCPLKDHNTVKRLHRAQVLKTLTNRVIFTTTGPGGLQEHGELFKDLLAQYEEKQAFLVAEVLAVAKSYGVVIDQATELIARLDVVSSLAHVAVNAPVEYVRPSMVPMATGNLELKAARHPCMEWHENVNFIPNDYNLNREESRFNIVTGPNMGGKSTYIRQLGVICVMAQIGSFVPAEAATLPVMDAIWARVGAGDHQLKGISTFMAEMLEAAAIVKNATASSLVIIDELGRGTSTYDGFGLAWAIADHLVNKCCSLAFFATHFHELTAMERDHAAVANLHVSAHTTENSITMLYNVRPGACDRSYGIHVAEVVGFPKAVLEGAKRKVKEFESASNQAVAPAVGGGTLSPTSKKGAPPRQLTASEQARLSAFVSEFRALDKDEVREKGKELIAAFRKDCAAAGAGLADLTH